MNLIKSVLLLILLIVPSSLKAEDTSSAASWNLIGRGALIVDVRSPEEYASGHIDGAINIPYDQIDKRVSELGADKARDIVLYCKSGRRAGLALNTLKELGFSSLTNAGGYKDLVEAKPKS